MQPCYDSITSLAGALESEAIKTLVVGKRRPDGGIDYLVIDPSPPVELITQSSREIYRGSSSLIEVGDYITHVSRKYSEEQLFGDGIFYLIDADISAFPPAGGIVAYLAMDTVAEFDEHFWRLTLRQKE
ncbi:MAG TPA: hypothetical protein V6D07_19020 [Trichocoleus sp.]